MKGVLIGSDFLVTEDGIKLLEINTDTDLFPMDLPFLDLSNLMTYLTTNSYTKLVLIYKTSHVSLDTINKFQEECNLNNITLEKLVISNSSITIPAITEEPNTFYFRCAYDVTAIIDDTYCRDKSEIVKLLMGTENESMIPKTYVKYTGDSSVLDNLNSVETNGEHPNLIAKKILPDFNRGLYPEFYKVTTPNELESIKTNLSDSLLLQEYNFSTSSLEYGKICNVIRTWNILLSDVETMIDLGGHYTINQISLDFDTITYTGNVLDNKWRYMYFSNPMTVATGVPGDYEVIKYVDGVETISTISQLNVGDVIKSVKANGLSATASIYETIDWSASGSLDSVIEYTSASVIRINTLDSNVIPNPESYASWFNELTYQSGSVTNTSLLAAGEQILVRDVNSSLIRFKYVSFINPGDKIITSLNNEIDLVSNNKVWYTGSIYTIDIEPDDVFVAGTDLNDINANTIGNILIHNKFGGFSY
jgi:hypothetical protein